MNCGEFDLDDLLVITAIPISKYSVGTHDWQLTPTIPNASFSPSLEGSVVIGWQYPKDSKGNNIAIAGLIPMMNDTGKAKDDEGDSVAGRKHTVKVSCEADTRDPATLAYLLTLERTPSHLLLTYRNGTQAFVSATEDTYTCEVDHDGSKTSVSFDIENLMGIQRITT